MHQNDKYRARRYATLAPVRYLSPFVAGPDDSLSLLMVRHEHTVSKCSEMERGLAQCRITLRRDRVAIVPADGVNVNVRVVMHSNRTDVEERALLEGDPDTPLTAATFRSSLRHSAGPLARCRICLL